jgi:hypothetical protein
MRNEFRKVFMLEILGCQFLILDVFLGDPFWWGGQDGGETS